MSRTEKIARTRFLDAVSTAQTATVRANAHTHNVPRVNAREALVAGLASAGSIAVGVAYVAQARSSSGV